ncbi:MAG: hypothetical protein EPN37_10550 [Chitinophagaceae bacterium]|nr:MAG: hypothetical protein EPN37_10550 [Chitinophagaceae bacterium]
MVAKIMTGKSIRGILNYNENKVKKGEAKLLMAAGFPRSPDTLSFKNKLQRFEMLTRQNERTKTNALHITLNFSPKDMVDEELLKRIALNYMEQIGFGDQPFLVYQHFDAAHPHIHIATTNIADGGQRIETHNIGRILSEKARKTIEETYGLIRAENQKKEKSFLLKPVNIEKALYGKLETKAAISSIVRSVVAGYKFTSLPELNAILRQFNVIADRGKEGSRMYEKKGLIYHLLDVKGNKTGTPIKASSIYGKPTLPNLEKQFLVNKVDRTPYGQRLKHILDKALTCNTRREFIDTLEKQQVRVVFRENTEGRIYGITFIDNAACTVFNGSGLGKEYAAKAFLSRMPGNKSVTGIFAPPEEYEAKIGGHLPQKLPDDYFLVAGSVFLKMTDALLEPVEEYDEPTLLRRRKQRKKNELSQS